MPNYLPETLENAISAVKEGGSSTRAAAKNYGIQFNTLRKQVKGISEGHRPGPKTALSTKSENELAEAIKEFNKHCQGLSPLEVRKLAGDISQVEVQDGVAVKGFEKEDPSRMWLRRYYDRHNLTSRKPRNISVARMRMETQEVKNEFFSSLKSVYDELIPQGLTGDTIYNLDETGLCVVTNSGRVVASVGEIDVRSRQGGERGENVTVMAAHNATGTHSLPPMVIFKGKTINHDLTIGAKEGVMFACSPKGFINSELFEEYFDRFVSLLPAKRPVLLILDGHGSHITWKVIVKARAAGITILCLPPHTTHLYQPLDKCTLGMLKIESARGARVLKRKNKIKALNRYHFNQVLTVAWERAITMRNMVAGFSGTGIWSYNPDAVRLPGQQAPVERLEPPAPGDDAEQPAPGDNAEQPATGDDAEQPATGDDAEQPAPAIQPEQPAPMVQPEPPAPAEHPVEATENRVLVQQATPASPESPVVQVIRSYLAPIENTPKVRSKQVTTSRLITSDEFLKEIEEKKNEKAKKEAEKQNKKIERENAKEERLKRKRAKDQEKVKAKPKNDKKKKRPRRETENSEGIDDDLIPNGPISAEEDAEDNELCGTCPKSFQKDFAGEQWIKCCSCSAWYHLVCQNLDTYDPSFLCDECTPLDDIVNKENIYRN